MVAEGHPGGIAGIFGAGGWISVPLALVIGLLIALALRVRRGAPRPSPPRPRLLAAPAAAGGDRRAHRSGVRSLGEALARRLAPRGPPLASV